MTRSIYFEALTANGPILRESGAASFVHRRVGVIECGSSIETSSMIPRSDYVL